MDSKEAAPYFHALAIFALKRNRFFRVYVGPKELLFIEAGPGEGNQVVAQSAIHGGLIGALIGGLIARRMQQRTQRRAQLLDAADWDELVQLAKRRSTAFASSRPTFWLLRWILRRSSEVRTASRC